MKNRVKEIPFFPLQLSCETCCQEAFIERNVLAKFREAVNTHMHNKRIQSLHLEGNIQGLNNEQILD